MSITQRRSAGFSLLEVMVALAIFSVGLLGLGGLLVVSVKTNHSAYNRTQATFLAQSMADRIRANRQGLWTDRFNGNYSAATATPPGNTCETTAGCSVNDMILRERAMWSAQLAAFLPNVAANVNCTQVAGGSAVTSQQQEGDPPFNGLCTIRMTWSEANVDTSQDATATSSRSDQTFAWVFQP